MHCQKVSWQKRGHLSVVFVNFAKLKLSLYSTSFDSHLSLCFLKKVAKKKKQTKVEICFMLCRYHVEIIQKNFIMIFSFHLRCCFHKTSFFFHCKIFSKFLRLRKRKLKKKTILKSLCIDASSFQSPCKFSSEKPLGQFESSYLNLTIFFHC